MAEKTLAEIKVPQKEIKLNLVKKEIKLKLPGLNVNITPSFIVLAVSIAIAGLILVLHLGFGGYQAWRISTGFREMNHPTYKQQEINYPQSPEGVVRVGGNEPDVTTRDQAMALKNPIKPTAKTLEEGKQFYYIYCSPCHGRSGDGQGIMGMVPALSKVSKKEEKDLSQYLSGFEGFQPKVDLNLFHNEDDNQLYYTITEGGELIMPKFYDAMDPDQRWKLINYIKWGLGNSGI